MTHYYPNHKTGSHLGSSLSLALTACQLHLCNIFIIHLSLPLKHHSYYLELELIISQLDLSALLTCLLSHLV